MSTMPTILSLVNNYLKLSVFLSSFAYIVLPNIAYGNINITETHTTVVANISDESITNIAPTSENVNLTDTQKTNYAIGYMMGQDFSGMFAELDLDAFHLGFRSAYLNQQPLLSKSEMQQLIAAYFKQQQRAKREALETKGKINLSQAEAFLTENKTKEGIITTDSGLQYKILKQGTGSHPKETDTVTVNYEGTLLDGTIFDNSFNHGRPLQFPLNQVIDGWEEGVQLMNKGAKYKFFIHPDLAYGNIGTTGIEPNSLLIFTVELVDFEE